MIKQKTLKLPFDLLVMLKLLSLGSYDNYLTKRDDGKPGPYQKDVAKGLCVSTSRVNGAYFRLTNSRLANGSYYRHRLVGIHLITDACAEFLSVIKYFLHFTDPSASLWDEKYHRDNPMEYTTDFRYLCNKVTRLIHGEMPDDCENAEDLQELLKVELEAIYR